MHSYLCPTCWSKLEPLAAPFCTQCALPFEFDAEQNDLCGTCLRQSPDFDWARAAVSYEDMGRSLVLRLKHRGAAELVPALAQMMEASLSGTQCDLLVPVPLHKRRLLSRRFNQSHLLAQALASKLGISSDTRSLTKRKPTVSQGGLGRKARYKNVEASFAIAPGKHANIEGRHILLVDDVLTTGATASACARTLKRAGAASVGVAVFARVGRPVAG